MSSKRGQMSKKRPTQIELERQNSELKKQVQQLQKRLKQALRQLRNEEDISYDAEVAIDLEQEANFQNMMAGNPQPDEDQEFIVVHLANGQVKKIRKRTQNQ